MAGWYGARPDSSSRSGCTTPPWSGLVAFRGRPGLSRLSGIWAYLIGLCADRRPLVIERARYRSDEAERTACAPRAWWGRADRSTEVDPRFRPTDERFEDPDHGPHGCASGAALRIRANAGTSRRIRPQAARRDRARGRRGEHEEPAGPEVRERTRAAANAAWRGIAVAAALSSGHLRARNARAPHEPRPAAQSDTAAVEPGTRTHRRSPRPPSSNGTAGAPVHQPRAVVARVQRPGPVRGPGRPQSAARARAGSWRSSRATSTSSSRSVSPASSSRSRRGTLAVARRPVRRRQLSASASASSTSRHHSRDLSRSARSSPPGHPDRRYATSPERQPSCASASSTRSSRC